MAAITITTAGRNLLRDGNKGANNIKISYIALGTSNAAPSANDTKLGSEFFRKSITSHANGASNGQILADGYIAPNEANGTAIAEVGFFGGNSATSAANSGVLIARGLYSKTKVNTESLVLRFDYTTA